jgi:cytochrome c oxidase assembly protein subunit 11
MPVVFYVDPAIVDQPETKDIRTITLSYTFFPTPEKNPAAADAGGDQTTKDGKLGG